MKYLLYVLFTIIPVLGISQFVITEPTILSEFVKVTPASKANDNLHTQTYMDSLVKVSHGITIVLPLHKEIVKWPSGTVNMIRYYNGLVPFGEWSYLSQAGDTLYSLFHYSDYVLLKSHKEKNHITRVRKFESLDNLEYATCSEQQLYPDGHILATGDREPHNVANRLALVETGKWKYFFPSGKLESVGKFREGRKDGKWVYYNKDGRKIRVVTFNYGELVTEKSYSK